MEEEEKSRFEVLKQLLEDQYHHYDQNEDFKTPDPLVVLKKYQDDEAFSEIALLCALFAYGNAGQIVRFLNQLDFSLLRRNEEKIIQSLFPYYRFQNQKDVRSIFLVMARILQAGGLKQIAMKGYKKSRIRICHVINACIQSFYAHLSDPVSFGIQHFFQKPIQNINTHSALKRYNLFLRWMVRRDHIDFGIWQEIETKDLILPLDTHTFRICQKLGILKCYRANLRAALLVTEELKKFDPIDPVRFDFALYRIGQSRQDKALNF